MLSHVVREKQILARMDHPFILALVASYQDAGELYMLEDLGCPHHDRATDHAIRRAPPTSNALPAEDTCSWCG